MMRGAAVEAGRHPLVYSFRPASFRIGLAVSGLGLSALALLTLWSINGVRRPQSSGIRPANNADNKNRYYLRSERTEPPTA